MYQIIGKYCWHNWKLVDEWENNLPGCLMFCKKYTCKKCGESMIKESAFFPGRKITKWRKRKCIK